MFLAWHFPVDGILRILRNVSDLIPSTLPSLLFFPFLGLSFFHDRYSVFGIRYSGTTRFTDLVLSDRSRFQPHFFFSSCSSTCQAWFTIPSFPMSMPLVTTRPTVPPTLVMSTSRRRTRVTRHQAQRDLGFRLSNLRKTTLPTSFLRILQSVQTQLFLGTP